MVSLNRIYTKTGDDGSTGLVDGTRVRKHHARVEAYGTVDEANAIFGLLRLETLEAAVAEEVQRIQNDLFDLGSDLGAPFGSPFEGKLPRIVASQVARLETAIDAANARLEPLRSFVLPGGSRAAAWLHLARTVVRRAERCAWAAADAGEQLNPQALEYLNRLSDLCFVWSRLCNDDGRSDILWMPGGNR
jgi:cob(I)alamin adenosyltransferase